MAFSFGIGIVFTCTERKGKKLDKMANTVQKKHSEFHLKLPADCENLNIIRRFVIGIARGMGFHEDEIYQIEVAVDEASANVIEHAYIDGQSKERNIDVAVKQNPDQIEITIADSGVGFKPDALKTPDMEEYLKEMKPGGMGVHLIRTLMDDVNFCINPGFCNEVKMVKYRQNQPRLSRLDDGEVNLGRKIEKEVNELSDNLMPCSRMERENEKAQIGNGN